MTKASPPVALIVLVLFGFASASRADDGHGTAVQTAEERLLGRANEDDKLRELLPFTRQIVVSGTVKGSFETSTAAAGVPPSAMLEAQQAFATSINLERDVQNGDHFYVRYEQTFTVEGVVIGVGRVLWAEVRTAAQGTVAIHRFRTRDKVERFWLANGQAATLPPIRLPLAIASISSGFGLRVDPFDQPPPTTAVKSNAIGGPLRGLPLLTPGLKPAPTTREVPLSSYGGSLSYGKQATVRQAKGLTSYGGSSGLRWQQAPRSTRSLFMHEGVDLAAPAGTPVHAAADGIVFGAEPNGRYGNWIRIDHAGKLATVYAHLAGFAPGIRAGSAVSRGDVIGYVGSTGRSTGAHLHFELLSDGKPVNPINHPDLKRSQLTAPDLHRFRQQVTQSLTVREREAAVATSTAN